MRTAILLLVGAMAGISVSFAGAPQSSPQRGEYLVSAGDCIACHTTSGGKPFAGGLYMPTPFGDISVPNITPDRETGIGAWSDADFYRAMHEGIGVHGEYLYPVFPFPWYTKVSRRDVSDIFAYLRSLPPVHSPRRPLKLSFPASHRESLLAWRTLFFRAGDYQTSRDQSPEVNRGAYLVEGLGHCGECHNQHNEAGASHWSGVLQGGQIEGWYAPNLTSDTREGVGSWSAPELARFLETGASPHGGLSLGPMQQVIRDSTSRLTRSDLAAIAAYLKSTPPRQTFTAAVGSEFAGSHPPGSETYLTFCGSCHGLQGEGIAHATPPLTHNGAILAQGPENVIRVILGGLPASRGLAPMPAIGVSMSDRQIADVTNYVRNAFGNAAPGTAEAGSVAGLRTSTHTVLTGDPAGGCPATLPEGVAKALKANAVPQKLATMNDESMLRVIGELAPKLRAATNGAAIDEIVNAMTDTYCGTLKSRSLTPTARSESLGNFSVLTYSELRSGDRG